MSDPTQAFVYPTDGTPSSVQYLDGRFNVAIQPTPTEAIKLALDIEALASGLDIAFDALANIFDPTNPDLLACFPGYQVLTSPTASDLPFALYDGTESSAILLDSLAFEDKLTVYNPSTQSLSGFCDAQASLLGLTGSFGFNATAIANFEKFKLNCVNLKPGTSDSAFKNLISQMADWKTSNLDKKMAQAGKLRDLQDSLSTSMAPADFKSFKALTSLQTSFTKLNFQACDHFSLLTKETWLDGKIPKVAWLDKVASAAKAKPQLTTKLQGLI